MCFTTSNRYFCFNKDATFNKRCQCKIGGKNLGKNTRPASKNGWMVLPQCYSATVSMIFCKIKAVSCGRPVKL